MNTALPVLVVEDSFLIAASLEDGLVEAGLQVMVARSVEEAEAAMSTTRFGAALLDYFLPDGESLMLARALHAEGCQVALVSAVDREVVPDNAPIAAHFAKPMDEDEVVSWVRAVSDRGLARPG